MSARTIPPDAPSDSGRDEAFWTALFAQEEPSAQTPRFSPTDSATNQSERPSTAGQAAAADPWQAALQAMDTDEVLHVRVRHFNKGGLIIYWQGLQGFVPASQLVDFPQFHIETQRLQALEQWVGRQLRLKIIEVNPDSNRLILSERASQVTAAARDRLLSEVQPGDRLTGVVSNLTDFGVFLDLGGIEGLIHISELAWSRVTHPSKVLKPGDTAEVLVLSVDAANGRIALSRKRLHRNPWQGIETRYQPGQMVSGTISNITSFGAFVQVEPELEGLVHISELAEGNFLHPRNVVRRGDHVQARVLAVDGRKKRLALSLRTASTDSDIATPSP
ncbi:MAG: S1 RNA-binding domain-containing protein [Anaerolineales bacterium]|nr:S1 RNA-binding domain-containing protein [Anaerolineales bacterium]